MVEVLTRGQWPYISAGAERGISDYQFNPIFLQNVGEKRTIPEMDKMSGELHHSLEIVIHHFQASLWC